MAKQVKFEDVMIPIFDGASYPSWKIRLMTLLEYKECKEQAVRKIAAGDNATEWNKKDLKARTIFISTISDRQLEYVGECTTAFDMITKFDKMYSTQSTALQIICRGKIEEVKLSNYSEVEAFFADFEKAINDFKTAGGRIDEAEKLRYLLRALPPSYSYIGDFIDVIPEDQRTVDYVKSKIKEKNLNKTENERKDNVSTFTTKTKVKCSNCGKPGHHARECWHGQQSNQGRGAQRYQFRGQRGFQRSFNRGGSYRGRTRGRGSGQPRSESSNEVHIEDSAVSKNDSTEAWTTEVITQSYSPEVNQARRYDKEKTDKNYSEINWLLDSGSTDHIINDDKFFEKYIDLKNPIDVKLPDGKKLKATKLGSIKIYFKNYYNEKQVELKDVYYVRDIRQNLLSLSKITKNCTIIARNENAKIYNQYRELIAVANKTNNLYCMTSFAYKNEKKEMYVNALKLTAKEKWHRALGHVNFQYLSKLVNNKLLEGLPDKIESTKMKCANCIESKMANIPFDNDRKKSTEILELIHTDLNGPHKTIGCGGEKYFLTFVDDYSKCTKIFCIKSKGETASCFIEYVNLVENKFNKRVKKLQCDNGKEYMNREIFNFIKYKGIELLPCPPYVHELNGVAERYNRSAMDIGRCLLREAKIHRKYWPEIMKTVAYLKNRTIANTVENKSPYEIFFGIKPNVEHLKIYGSRVFVRVPEAKRQTKWDDKAELGVLVGYVENGYRVLVNNRVINARHVKIVEEDTKLICLEEDDDQKDRVIDNYESEESETEENSQEENKITSDNAINDSEGRGENTNELQNESQEQTIQTRTSNRRKNPINRYGNPISHVVYINYVNANIPSTFEEALNSNESKEWQNAMNSEIESLKKNNTWQVVEKPKDKQIIDVKWIYKKKNNNTYKARLVVRGFQQKEHFENVYSPVSRMQTLKILLSHSCRNNFFIEQMDVETAFLNGRVKTEVYINEPKGYETGENRVCKLKRALYGLRESPRAWYDCFNKFVQELGFIRSNHDYCLYVNCKSKDSIYILVFVDDLLICSKDKMKIHEVKASLMERFAMKDLGKIGNYIGIDIDYNDQRNKMTLCQTRYIESLATKYNLENARLYDTPMETNLKLDPATEIEEEIKYRNLIGELLYISTGTRPDISYSVNYLSRYQSCYDSTHFKYAMRVLKYLYKTKDMKLIYYDNLESETLDCMVDSDYAGDNIDRKSTTGFVIRLYGNLIFWKTHKQNTVTKCSTFAEYTAMSEAVTEILFVKNLLNESFNIKFDKAITMYEDNSGAIAIAKFGNFTKNSKHIEVQFHYINEHYEKGTIDIVKIDSQLNLADMLTKSLDKAKFVRMRKALRLI